MCNCTNNKPIKVKFAKVRENAKIPTKRKEDAGYDLYVALPENQDFIRIDPHTSVLVPVGIKSVIPPTHYAQIFERGSTGIRNLKFNAGVIDSGFRGEWQVVLYNGNDRTVIIESQKSNFLYSSSFIKYPIEKAIAQFVILPVPEVNIEEITEEELMECSSERMEGMLGASGK